MSKAVANKGGANKGGMNKGGMNKGGVGGSGRNSRVGSPRLRNSQALLTTGAVKQGGGSGPPEVPGLAPLPSTTQPAVVPALAIGPGTQALAVQVGSTNPTAPQLPARPVPAVPPG